MTVRVTKLRIRDTRSDTNSRASKGLQAFLLRAATDHQQLLTQLITRLNSLINILVGQQTRNNQEVIVRFGELFQTRNRLNRCGGIYRVRREENRNVLLSVDILDALLNHARIRYVHRRTVSRPVIPQHQCRTQSLQQQRHGTGALLTQVLIAQVQPTRRRMAVNELTASKVEAVRPTGRRHHSTLSRYLQERRSKRQNRQRHTVVTTQVTNLVQRTRYNLRVLELGEGTLRIVQSRVNRCVRERTVHRQNNTLRAAALSQIVVGNRNLFSRLRLNQRHVTARQAAKLLEALRDISKHRVRILRPGKRSGGQELSE